MIIIVIYDFYAVKMKSDTETCEIHRAGFFFPVAEIDQHKLCNVS